MFVAASRWLEVAGRRVCVCRLLTGWTEGIPGVLLTQVGPPPLVFPLGGGSARFLSRAALFSRPGGETLFCGASDESERSVLLWDVATSARVQQVGGSVTWAHHTWHTRPSFPTGCLATLKIRWTAEEVMSMAAFGVGDEHYLATACHSRLELYRWGVVQPAAE